MGPALVHKAFKLQRLAERLLRSILARYPQRQLLADRVSGQRRAERRLSRWPRALTFSRLTALNTSRAAEPRARPRIKPKDKFSRHESIPRPRFRRRSAFFSTPVSVGISRACPLAAPPIITVQLPYEQRITVLYKHNTLNLWWKGRDSKRPAKYLKSKIFDLADRISAPSRTPTASALTVRLVGEHRTIQRTRSPDGWRRVSRTDPRISYN